VKGKKCIDAVSAGFGYHLTSGKRKISDYMEKRILIPQPVCGYEMR
jgi:hypothetical protein